MASLDRLIAEQVRDTIIAAGLVSPDPSPVAIDADVVSVRYLPIFRPEDVDDLVICIAPLGRQLNMASRRTNVGSHTIQVGLFQRVEADTEHFEGLLDLAVSIDDLLSHAHDTRPAGVTLYGKWESSTCRLFDVDRLHEHQIFDSRLTITYRAYS